jgi:hypothetical protein
MKGDFIEYGYDRSKRSWCIVVFDEKCIELTSSYVGDKEGLKHELEYLKKQYNVEEVYKIKPY